MSASTPPPATSPPLAAADARRRLGASDVAVLVAADGLELAQEDSAAVAVLFARHLEAVTPLLAFAYEGDTFEATWNE